MEKDNETGRSPNHLKHLMSRRSFLGTAAAAVAATTLGSYTQGAEAAEDDVLKVKKRFTLAAGTSVTFNQNLQIPMQLANPAIMGANVLAAGATQGSLVDADQRLCIGVNMPIGARLDLAQLILEGDAPQALAGDIGKGRLITKNQIVIPADDDPNQKDGPYVKLGETKVSGVSPESVALAVTLKPNHRMTLVKMTATKFIPEGELVITPYGKDATVITNTTQSPQKVVLIIPQEEYTILAPKITNGRIGAAVPQSFILKTGKLGKAEDFEVLQEKMQQYQQPKMIADAKIALLLELKPLIENTRNMIVADLLTRQKDPKKEPVYSDSEVKEFSGPIYDEAIKRGVIPPEKAVTASKSKAKKPEDAKPSPDGIWEKFEKRFKLEPDRIKDKVLDGLKEKNASLDRPENHVEGLAMSESPQRRRKLLDGLFPEDGGRGGGRS